MGCPLVVHYWADMQSVHGLRCYGNITQTRSVSEYMLVLALCLVLFFLPRYACMHVHSAVYTVCVCLLRNGIASKKLNGLRSLLKKRLYRRLIRHCVIKDTDISESYFYLKPSAKLRTLPIFFVTFVTASTTVS